MTPRHAENATSPLGSPPVIARRSWRTLAVYPVAALRIVGISSEAASPRSSPQRSRTSPFFAPNAVHVPSALRRMRRHGRDKRLKKVEVDSKSQVCCWKPQVFACDFKSAATLSRRRCSAVDSSHPYRPRLLIGPAHFRDLSSFIGPAHFPLFESFTWPGPFLRFESARLLRLSSSTGGRPPPPARLPPSPSSHPLPCHLLILVFSSPSRLLLLLLLSSQRRPQGQGPAAPQQVSSNTQITTQFNTTQTASISNTPAASSRSRPRRTPAGEGMGV